MLLLLDLVHLERGFLRILLYPGGRMRSCRNEAEASPVDYMKTREEKMGREGRAPLSPSKGTAISPHSPLILDIKA